MAEQIDGNQPVVVIEASDCGPEVLRAGEDCFNDGLTDLQRSFILAFIENGGRAIEAAQRAGYGGGAAGMATRNLAKRKIQDEIERRLKLQRGSALAIAIGNLLAIIEKGGDERARVQAALGIMDRFGMAPPRGPTVAVQVNNGITPGEANSLIAEALRRRDARLLESEAA